MKTSKMKHNCLLALVVLAYFAFETSAYRCPGSEWFPRKGSSSCYFVYKAVTDISTPGAESQTFEGAVTECQIRGGELFIPVDAGELEYVETRLLSEMDYYWIGLFHNGNNWVWGNGNSTQRPFVQPEFPNFQVFLPESAISGSEAIYRATLTYDFASNKFIFAPLKNNTKEGYICKAAYSARPWCKTEEGWNYDNGKCYLHVPELQFFAEAQNTCFLKGGFISTINSEREDERMKVWMRKKLGINRAWLGITIPNKSNQTTINNVKWEDGTPITDTLVDNWDLGLNKNLSQYISNLVNGRTYCGELFSQELFPDYEDYDSLFSGLGLFISHDWQMLPNCNTTRRPFACETEINKCPYGWDELNGTCYQFNGGPDDLKSWFDAKEACTNQGGNLVVIQTENVQNYLREIVWDRMTITGTQTISHFWIGARRAKEEAEKNFVWLSGQNVSSGVQYWAAGSTPETPGLGQPSLRDDYCVFIDGRARWQTGNWNASLCTQKLAYICEAKSDAAIQPPEINHPDVMCNAPFSRYHDGCYLVVKEKMNRDMANENCRAKDASAFLVTINTHSENEHILSQISQDSWIGIKALYLNAAGTRWVFGYADNNIVGAGAFENVMGYPLNQIPINDNKLCFFMVSKNRTDSTSIYNSHGGWEQALCTDEKASVCYHPGTPMGPVAPPDDLTDPECGAGWARGTNHCYKINNQATTWHLAKQNCQNTGPHSDLLYITSKAEEMFIRSLTDGVFIGPLPAGMARSDAYWIDFYADKVGGWYWPYRSSKDRNHIPTAVFNWDFGEPTYSVSLFGNPTASATNPRCAYMQEDEEGSWKAFPCTRNKAYICKKPLLSHSSTLAPPIVTPATGFVCLPGYFALEELCLKFNGNHTDWFTARDSCRANQGELLAIHTQRHYQLVSRFIDGSWIGLNSLVDPQRPRVFVWSDNSSVRYTPWDTNSDSDDIHGIGPWDVNCVAGAENGFATFECEELKPSICMSSMHGTSTGPDTIPVPHDEGCDRWGIGHEGSCYYFGQDPSTQFGMRPVKTFEGARSFCQSTFDGSDLITIGSEREERFLTTIIGSYQADYWIGLKEEVNPWNAFKTWIDGTSVTRTKWGYGEPRIGPNGATGCVAMQGAYKDDLYPGDWKVVSCHTTMFALCEAPRRGIPTRAPTTPPPLANGCPKNWKTTPTSTRCYMPYYAASAGLMIIGPGGTMHKATWDDAENFCREFQSGHLASISSEEEQNTILASLPLRMTDYNYWIGLKEKTSAISGTSWGWSDNSPYTTAFFHPTVNHESELTDCAAMDAITGKWIPQTCQMSWGWVCEVAKGAYRPDEEIPVLPTAIPTNTTCGRETSGYGDWFYAKDTDQCMFISKRTETWENSVVQCLQRRSQLAIITPNNTHFITQKASQYSNQQSYWIGLHVTNLALGEYQWVDHSPLTTSFWEVGQPVGAGGDYCATVNSASGRWRDRRCNSLNYFICLKSGSPSTTPAPTPNPEIGGCLPGWFNFRGSCYFMSPNGSTFGDALDMCRNQLGAAKADLISITDSGENDFIVTRLKGEKINYWIGLHEIAADNFVWTDGTPYIYNNWHFDYPRYSSALECIEVLSENNKVGRWTDVSCSKLAGYICEAPKDPSLPVPIPIVNICPTGYSQYGDACFSVKSLPSSSTGWSLAQQLCTTATPDGNIATVSDIYENAFIRSLMDTAGAASNTAIKGWIGMKETYGHYEWHNTCPTVFTSLGSLIGTADDNSCVYTNNHGRWFAVSCADVSIGHVVCEKRIAPCPAVANFTGGQCPSGFPSKCDNYCYKVEGVFHHDNRSSRETFATARKKCQDLGGDLASIRTAEEQSCVQAHVTSAEAGMWIGLVETENNGTFSWGWVDEGVNFEAASYANWAQGEPNGGWIRESCAEMYPNGWWNNVQCSASTMRGYICEAAKLNPGTPGTGPTEPPITHGTYPANWTGSTTTGPPLRPTSTEELVAPDRGGGLSSGQVAGIVIGVLLMVGILGGVIFVVVTGRTSAVLDRFSNVASSAREGGARFVSRKYRKGASDTESVIPTGDTNPNYQSETYS